MPLSHASNRYGRRFAASALLVLAVACGDGMGGPCPDEVRSATAGGDIVDIRGRRLGGVTGYVSEQRDSARSSQYAYFGINLFGPSDAAAGPLRGHVARLRLLGPGDTLIVMPPLERIPPGETGGAALARALFVHFDDTTSVAPLRQLLLQGRLRVELTTDEQPSRTFLVPLRQTGSKDWVHLMCL